MHFYLLILVLYSFLLIAVGFLVSRAVKRAGDFFVADRNLGTGLLCSTLLAANIGAGSTVGAAGLGYQFGLSAWWWVGSAGIGSLFLAFAVGPRLWRLAQVNRFYTLGDYLQFRYDRRVQLSVSILLTLGALAILAGQLIAIAWILNAVAGTPKWLGCLLGGAVVTLYFSAGGLVSTVWVNSIQLLVKGVGFLLATPFALPFIGGVAHLQQQLQSQWECPLDYARYFSLSGIGFTGILNYLLLLAPAFIVSPALLQKIYGARNTSVVRQAVFLNAMGLLFFAFLPPLIGMAARSAFPLLPHRELALPMVTVHLLPYGLGALLLAAVFSAEISSADAVLSMLSTSISRDLVQSHFVPSLSEFALMRIARLTSVISGSIGVVVAMMIPTVIGALKIFYTLLTAALFVPLIAGLYWKKPNALAAIVAIGVSVLTTVLIEFTTSGRGLLFLPPIGWGIVSAVVGLLLVTEVDRTKILNRGGQADA